MKYKNVIWDWNGTLLDDLDACISIFRDMSAHYEMRPVSREEYRENFGFPVANFYIKYGFNPEKYSFGEISKIFAAHFAELRKTCPLQRGSDKALSALEKFGARQSVLSAYESSALLESVAEKNISHFFEKISGLKDNFAASKIELGMAHIKSLKLTPAETVMVGDTLHDSEVAKALGIDCALLSCGHHSKGRLLKSGHPVFDNHAELLDWLLD